MNLSLRLGSQLQALAKSIDTGARLKGLEFSSKTLRIIASIIAEWSNTGMVGLAFGGLQTAVKDR